MSPVASYSFSSLEVPHSGAAAAVKSGAAADAHFFVDSMAGSSLHVLPSSTARERNSFVKRVAIASSIKVVIGTEVSAIGIPLHMVGASLTGPAS